MGSVLSVTLALQFVYVLVSGQSLCPTTTGPLVIRGTASIADNAYKECSTITSLVIPSYIETIGRFAFAGCSSLSDITLSIGLTVLGDEMFYMMGSPSALTKIVIPSTITSVAGYTFYLCSSLSDITLTNGLTVLGHYMFSNYHGPETHNLKTIVIPSTITSIGDYVFDDCNHLSDVTLTNGLTIIGAYMFHIYAGTFLTSIVIPSTVTSIGMRAFANIYSMQCVYWLGSVITSPTDIFEGSPSAKTCSYSPSGFPTLSPTTSLTFTPTVKSSSLAPRSLSKKGKSKNNRGKNVNKNRSYLKNKGSNNQQISIEINK